MDPPDCFKYIHPVFHAKLLRKDPNNLVSGHEVIELEQLNITPGEKEFTVENIRTVKLIRRQLNYRANWI